MYNFGGVSDELIKKHQKQLSIYRSQGLADTSEAVLGETLNVMGHVWMQEESLVSDLTSALAQTIRISHHKVGIMAQEIGYYVDIQAIQGTTLSKQGIDSDRLASIKERMLVSSAFEHGMLEQLMGSDNPAASTIKLLQIANSNTGKIYYVNSVNSASILGTAGDCSDTQLINYSCSDIAGFKGSVSSNHSLILPANGQLELIQWRGKGYIEKKFTVDEAAEMGMIIGGNYYGGYGSVPEFVVPAYLAPDLVAPETPNYLYIQVDQSLAFASKSFCGDPVNMGTGAYYFQCTDLKLGGDAPLGLAFSRTYSSDMNREKRVLGYGWTHNNETFLTETSYGDLGLGRRQPLDAVAMIAAIYAGVDLMRAAETSDAIEYWMTAALVSKWAVDQVINNAVSIYSGDRRMDYVKLPDGSYASPPGTTAQLTLNGGAYRLQERFGTRMDFNSAKRLYQIVDADGNAMTFTYNESNNLATVQDAVSRTLTIGYASGKINSVTDSASPSRSANYGYDVNNNLTSYTDPEGKVWQYGYDTDHRMTTMTNPVGITLVTNTYDGMGRVMTQTYPRQGGGTALHNYYFSGFRNAVVDNGNRTHVFYYDDKGREYAQVNPLGEKVVKEFDGQDHLTRVDGPRTDVSDVTNYYYDGKHNLTSIVNALSQTTTNTYDTQFRLTDVNSPLTHNTHLTYDGNHHLTATQDAVGNTTGASYYSNGLKHTATDGRGTVTTLTYDGYGNPLTSTATGHPAVTYAYDRIGRMTGLTDQAGSFTGFAFDKRNLLQVKTDPLGRWSAYAYDNAGRLTGKTDRKGETVSYTYTPTDKPDTITYPNATTVHFTYNNLDNLTSIQEPAGTTSFTLYDAADRMKSVTDLHGFVISYNYDAAGNVTRITYPGNKIVDYQYDSLNRLWKVLFNGLTATYNYNATSGRLTSLTQFNGTTIEYGYDNAYRLTSLQNKNSSTVIAGYQFTLDGNGNRIGVEQEEPQAPTSTPSDAAYTYNTQKNRLQSDGTNSFNYDNEGQLASGYGANYTFDYEHRLTTMGNSQFVYDARGNRIQATRNGGVTRYIYDAAGNLLAEADGNNNITRYYIHGLGLLAMATPANQVYCYHFNATGSMVAITNASRAVVNKYAYDPFGNITGQEEATGLSQPFKYVGQYGVMAEPNGFYYMRARYYDPQAGRFISEDPIGFDGGDVNLYAYVSSNPVNGIDPDGTVNPYAVGAGIGAAIGAVSALFNNGSVTQGAIIGSLVGATMGYKSIGPLASGMVGATADLAGQVLSNYASGKSLLSNLNYDSIGMSFASGVIAGGGAKLLTTWGATNAATVGFASAIAGGAELSWRYNASPGPTPATSACGK